MDVGRWTKWLTEWRAGGRRSSRLLSRPIARTLAATAVIALTLAVSRLGAVLPRRATRTAPDTAAAAAPPPATPAPRVPMTPLLPARRIVAYYGHPGSKRMGILGELPPEKMLAKLRAEVKAWEEADPATPVVPALDLIVTVAQPRPGKDGRYRLRTDRRIIDRVAEWADRCDCLLFLDVQTGHSNVAAELEPLLPLLRRPTVHLALDPEFSMREDRVPGEVIGSMDAAEVNEAIETLARIVREDGLPPKVLVVHRFTRKMLTGAERLRTDPSVQLVLDMDGFGAPPLKKATYRQYVARAGVPITGFKLFYKNDKPMMSAADILALDPIPFFILYQ